MYVTYVDNSYGSSSAHDADNIKQKHKIYWL